MSTCRSAGRTASSIGMMEGAFFVSRTDLLQWVNSLLQVNLAKVEQCASGAVYCQILDACHPGTVAMRKVNWMARADHEFIPNYKVLQAAFDRNCIERHIDVDKLIHARYQDNLEFLQWMKCYWEREGAGRRDYDPFPAREGKQTPPWARAFGSVATVAGKENLRPRPASGAEVARKANAAGRAPCARAPVPGAAEAPPLGGLAGAGAVEPTPLAAGNGEQVRKLNAQIAAQQEELDELQSALDGLGRERDYYFRKLRNVEILCTTSEVQPDPSLTAERVLADIQHILYASDEGLDGEAGEGDVPAGDL